jgi:hypothetical protein
MARASGCSLSDATAAAICSTSSSDKPTIDAMWVTPGSPWEGSGHVEQNRIHRAHRFQSHPVLHQHPALWARSSAPLWSRDHRDPPDVVGPEPVGGLAEANSEFEHQAVRAGAVLRITLIDSRYAT